MTDPTEPPPTDDADAARRPWYRSTPVLVITGGLVVAIGQFFVGLVAIVLLVGDRTRDRDTRIGGAVLIFWWAFAVAFARASGYRPLPYIGFTLLAIAGVFLVRAVLARRGQPWRRRLGVTVLAGLAGALAIVQLVPYGFRAPSVTREGALDRVADERRDPASDDEQIDATRALVVPARLLVLQKPYWVVATFEPNSDKAVTAGGEPCFRRLQTYFVDGLDGDVRRSKDILEAGEDDDGCLTLDEDSAADLVELPGG